MNVGESVTKSYTGGMQSFTVPDSGIYKLEAWGAGTSDTAYSSASARGGYAMGYAKLKKGEILYVCVGGSGGYNGGGSGAWYHDPVYAYFSCGSGGGATHIAKVTGLLSAIGETDFVTNGKGYLIAGGAGGSETYSIANGTVGGSNGGHGGTGGNNGHFGYGNNGASGDSRHGCGGGAGYRGGTGSSAAASGISGGGSGGTSWTGGVPSFEYKGTTYAPSSSSGQRNGNGQAVITLIEKTSSVKYGDKDVSVFYGTKEVSVYYGDKQV